MLGREHALSGLAAGAAAGEWFLHLSPGGTGVLAGLTAAMATLPDLDQCESSAARSLGWLSQAFAWVVEHLSGGHRHATHSVAGVAMFTCWAWAGYVFRHDPGGKLALALLLALALAAGARALHLGGRWADAAALAGGAALAFTGAGEHQVILAAGLGCAVHVCGDMLTTEGCPLAWPLSMYHVRVPEPFCFETGGKRETWGVLPVLLVVTGWLAASEFPVHSWTGRAHLLAALGLGLALGGLTSSPHLARRYRERRLDRYEREALPGYERRAIESGERHRDYSD
jgi:membrane-bound metal-dependent hydrolase YbcI (DUF457 family)